MFKTRSAKRRPLNLALQGGGAHGAFTWGVLDRLLEEDRFQFDTVSGTSAGAVNLAALASGLVTGGPDGARATLKAVWQAVSEAGLPPGAARRGTSPSTLETLTRQTLKMMTRHISPYTFNPLDLNPLRDLLLQHIDFEAVRESPPFQMLIAATDLQTGRARDRKSVV